MSGAAPAAPRAHEVNIVGFTLTARQGQQALAALASGTGGRFYSAQDGEALGRALFAAAVRRRKADTRAARLKAIAERRGE